MAALLVICATASPTAATAVASEFPTQRTVATAPNFVLLLTDDQDVRLGSMQAMPTTRDVLVTHGANLSNFFVHTPICCPSRATLLSGRFVQNNRVDNNAAKGCMRMNTSRDDNPEWWLRSVPVALHDLGYRTGLFGKVLNVMKTYGCDAGGEGDRLPPGISRQSIMCKIEYYNATFAEGDDAVAGGAVTVRTTGSLPTDYSTSIVGNASVNFVRDALTNHSAQPFFVWIGPHAPHLPSTPAPWYATDPIGLLEPPREAYFNASGAHRHAFLPDEPTINADDWQAIKTEYSNRMRSLLSVDDIVREIDAVLTAHAAWSNTYFLYLSDHGYNLGQFRVDSHKTMVYDHSTRIPAIIRGPGIAAASELRDTGSMADIAPTILELAGAPSNLRAAMDGSSLAPRLLQHDTTTVRDAALITYQSVRTAPVGEPDAFCDAACERDAYGYRVGPVGQTQWHAHDGPNNTFVALRVRDPRRPHCDFLYGEFADVTDPAAWTFPERAINFRELYNVSTGDWMMMENVHDAAPPALKTALRQKLHAAIACAGRAECDAALSDVCSVVGS